ncbi:hypothetical protein AB0A71_13980 [Kitasatospora aureofaciens]|uniref:hypothetical protein n=1 Tax=Kitasatospora aureofaciens TaxID=1894 RepID=UPI0033C995A2
MDDLGHKRVFTAGAALLALSSAAAAAALANNTARYLGSSLGVAVTVSLMGLGHPATARAAAAGADHAVLAATLLWLLGAAGALAVRAAQRRVSARYGS